MKAFYFWLTVLTLSAMLAGAATVKAASGVGSWWDVAMFVIWGTLAGSSLSGIAHRNQRAR